MIDAPIELIQARIATPGWTPGRKDIADLFAAWRYITADERESMQKRLAKIDAPSARKAAHLFSELDDRSRGELTRPILKAYIKLSKEQSVDWIDFPLACFSDAEARVRKAAAQAIGSAWAEISSQFKQRLIDEMIIALSRSTDESEKKALIDSLSKSSDPAALAALKRIDVSSRALLTLERDLSRAAGKQGKALCLPEKLASGGIIAWFTPGVDQLARSSDLFLGAEVLGTGILKPDRSVSWKDLGAHYLWRKAGVVIGRTRDQSPAGLVQTISSACHEISSATKRSEGSLVRIRLGRDEGRARSFIWDFAETLSKVDCGIINDGREAHWELRTVADEVVLLPLCSDDPRFCWRDSSVDGASDPTIAASLVKLAEIKPNDKVWDPFCGAGTELIIAKFTQPDISAMGTDISREAIKAASIAAEAAKVSIQFKEESCLSFNGGPFDVIMSNPPFGMRTVRGGARDLLGEFFARVRKFLSYNGRVVMLSHAPTSTVEWAEAGGLGCTRRLPVKLAGMHCEFQVFKH